MSGSHAAVGPSRGLPTLFGRHDLIGWFLSASVVIHGLLAVPWARVLLALLRVLGAQPSPIGNKDFDAPTIIPIDLDGLDDPAPGTLPPGDNPSGSGSTAPPGDAGPLAGGAGADAPSDAPGEAGLDGGDAETGPATPPRIKDPNSLAGGLVAITPKGKEVNVSMLMRFDHVREHPVGKDLAGRILAKVPDWKPLIDAGLDPRTDLDVLFAFGPRFHENSRVTMILVHHKNDELVSAALKAVSAKLSGETIETDDGVTAFRAKIDVAGTKADRVVVQIKSGVIITPPDGETQALAIARGLAKKGKTAADMVPKGDKDLVVAWFLRKPSNVYSGIPEDLTDAHITIRKRKDDGLIGDIDAKAKDDKHAKEDAEAARKLVEKIVPKGLVGMLVSKYVEGYKIESQGDVVHGHHELDGDQVNAIWTFMTTTGGI